MHRRSHALLGFLAAAWKTQEPATCAGAGFRKVRICHGLGHADDHVLEHGRRAAQQRGGNGARSRPARSPLGAGSGSVMAPTPAQPMAEPVKYLCWSLRTADYVMRYNRQT